MRMKGWFQVVIFVLFCLIGLGIYFNSLENGYHYDDAHHILKNPYLKTLDNLPKFFTERRTFSGSSRFHPHYRPLLLVSHSLNYYLGGLNPRGYHLANLGFHVGSAFLVFLILQTILVREPVREQGTSDLRANGLTDLRAHGVFPALAAGLVFLATPFNSEVVNYITARSSVMCSFFYLLAFWFWVKYRESIPPCPVPPSQGGTEGRRAHRLAWYTASFLAFLLAMLTKEIAITLPVLLWLYDFYFTGSRDHRSTGLRYLLNWRSYLPYLPFLGVGIGVGIGARVLLLGYFNSPGTGETLGVKFFIEVKVLAHYFLAVLVPVGLSVWHEVRGDVDMTFWVSLVFVIGLIAAAGLWLRRNDPLWKSASFFIVWFFMVLLPTTVIPLGAPYQENRGYLAGVGVVAIAAICLEKLIRASKFTRRYETIELVLVVVLLIVYSYGVIERNPVWKDELSLWSDVLKKYPHSKGGHLSLGYYYMGLGKLDLAEKEFQTVLAGVPEEGVALINLGIIRFRKQEYSEAEGLLLRAAIPRADDPLRHIFLGMIYEKQGTLEQALHEYLQVLKVAHDNMDIPAHIVGVSHKLGRTDEVFRNFSLLKEKDPGNPAVRRTLGLIYMQGRDFSQAAQEFKGALEIVPEDMGTLVDLGNAYFEMGDLPRAEQMFHHALSVTPGDPRASKALALVYQKQKANQGKEDSPRL